MTKTTKQSMIYYMIAHLAEIRYISRFKALLSKTFHSPKRAFICYKEIKTGIL